MREEIENRNTTFIATIQASEHMEIKKKIENSPRSKAPYVCAASFNQSIIIMTRVFTQMLSVCQYALHWSWFFVGKTPNRKKTSQITIVSSLRHEISPPIGNYWKTGACSIETEVKKSLSISFLYVRWSVSVS